MAKKQIRKEPVFQWFHESFGLYLLDPDNSAVSIYRNGGLEKDLGIPTFIADFGEEWSLILIAEKAAEKLGYKEEFYESDIIEYLEMGLEKDLFSENSYNQDINFRLREIVGKTYSQLRRISNIFPKIGARMEDKSWKDPFGRSNIIFPIFIREIPEDPSLIAGLELLNKKGKKVGMKGEKQSLIKLVPGYRCFELIEKNAGWIEKNFTWFIFREQCDCINYSLRKAVEWKEPDNHRRIANTTLLKNRLACLQQYNELDYTKQVKESFLSKALAAVHHEEKKCGICGAVIKDDFCKHIRGEHHVTEEVYEQLYPNS